MYPVSEAYKNAISQNERNVRITGTITLKDSSIINISDEDILQGSLYFTEQCVSGEDIEIGNVYASELGLTLTSPPENPYALDGARIALSFGIETSEGVWEYVPLGYFYVTEIERKQTTVNLKALDGMILFDVDLSGVLTTGTPYALIQSCCTKAGVTLATSSGDFADFANGLSAFTIPDESKIETCRDLIMWVCQITGTFARMNRLGQLEIVPVTAGESVKTISKQERFTSDVSDFEVKVAKVAMKVGETEYSQGAEGMTMVLEENPLLVGKSEAEINAALAEILAQVTEAEYTPYNLTFAGDPALQAGDYINLTGIKVFDKIRATFTRSSVAYLSDGTQVAANLPRFEPGKFGKAIMAEEGTTNKILYSEEFDRSNWTKIGVIITANSETALNGTMTADKMVEDTSTGNHIIIQSVTISSTSAPVAVSVYVKPAGRTKLRLYVISTSTVGVNFDLSTLTATNYIGNVIYKSIKSVGNGWYRLEFAGTASFASTTAWAVIALLDNSGNFSYTGDGVSGVYIWGMQFEEKQYPTTYMATTSSTATRSPESLTIPTAGVLNPQEGTIECWVYVNDILKDSIVNNRHIIDARGSGNNALILYYDRVTRNFRFRLRNYSGVQKDLDIPDSVVTNGWHFFSIKWSQTNMTLCIDNNVQFAENPPLPSDLSTCAIGSYPSVPTTTINTLIDDLRISSIACSDEEILAAYQSGQPLPVDEWTTLKLSFDDTLSGITTTGDSIITHSTWRYRGPHEIRAAGKSGLIRGVQAQQQKTASSIRAIAKAAQELAQAANQSTQLINDAIGGHVLIRQSPDEGETNEILIMDNPDPEQAVKIWRWNMGGLGYSDNVVGADNPAREYDVAMTMDGAINANFIRTGTMLWDFARGGTAVLGGLNNEDGILIVQNAEGDTIAELNAATGGFEELYVGNVVSNSVVKTNTTSFSLYVNPLTGSDDNDGRSWASAFETIQKAVDSIPRYNDATININVYDNEGDGITINDSVRIHGFIGNGTIRLNFGTKNTILNGFFGVRSCNNRVYVNDVSIQHAGGTDSVVTVEFNPGGAEFNNVVLYGNGAARYGFYCRTGPAYLYNCEVYNLTSDTSYGFCIVSAYGAGVLVQDCKGLGNYGLRGYYGGHFSGYGTAPMGTINNIWLNAGGFTHSTFNHDAGSATPPPPPERTDTWSSQAGNSWRDAYGGWRDGSAVWQGEWESYGHNRGYWFFGSAVRNAVNGKTISRIRVKLTRKNSGGSSGSVNAIIRAHGYASQPAETPTYVGGLDGTSFAVGFKWGESKWVTLPSSFHSLFAGGSAYGIGIYTSSTSNLNYMIFEPNAEIEITYQ